MSKSSIEWTEQTWNPLGGCAEISPGCVNCYAMTMAHRLAGMGQKKYQGTTKKLPNGKVTWTGKMNLDEAALQIPLKSKKPTMYFVNSMSDLFHEDVPDEFIDKVFAVMALCPQHTFQVLTKRAERMAAYMGEAKQGHVIRWGGEDRPPANRRHAITQQVEILAPGWEASIRWPLPNAWLGVSVENKKHGLPRIEHLLKTPAAVRMLSIEPLLEDLGDMTHIETANRRSSLGDWFSVFGGPFKDSPGVDWVIVGGESGHGARPFDIAWARSIIAQCKAAGVPCFVKQLGSSPVKDQRANKDGTVFCDKVWLKDKKGGDPLEWPEDLRVREMPERKAVQA